MSVFHKLKKPFVQALIVLVPSYIIAYTTNKMVYVVPMLAAMGFVAAAVFREDTEKRIDDDTDGYKDGFKEDGDSE